MGNVLRNTYEPGTKIYGILEEAEGFTIIYGTVVSIAIAKNVIYYINTLDKNNRDCRIYQNRVHNVRSTIIAMVKDEFEKVVHKGGLLNEKVI